MKASFFQMLWFLWKLHIIENVCMCVLSRFSHVRLFGNIWTLACQASLSMGFSRQTYRSGFPCPPRGGLPNPAMEPMSFMYPALGRQHLFISATWEGPNLQSLCLKIKGFELNHHNSFQPTIKVCKFVYIWFLHWYQMNFLRVITSLYSGAKTFLQRACLKHFPVPFKKLGEQTLQSSLWNMFLFISETAHKLIFFVLTYVLKRHLDICVCVCGDFTGNLPLFWGFSGGSDSNEFACNAGDLQETQVRSLGQGDPLDKGTATHFSILAWRLPWTEEPCGLQFNGSQRIRYNWVANTFTPVIIHYTWLNTLHFLL